MATVNRPTDVKQKEADINQKLQLYGIYSGTFGPMRPIRVLVIIRYCHAVLVPDRSRALSNFSYKRRVYFADCAIETAFANGKLPSVNTNYDLLGCLYAELLLEQTNRHRTEFGHHIEAIVKPFR